MAIELRIQSGARAGVSQTFDKSVIALGRHPMSDLRFDATQDLDVSTRHGEIRALHGRYAVHDSQSTNGTFVNGLRVPAGGSLPLRDKDVIAFGLEGPRVVVHIDAPEAEATPPKTMKQPVPPTPASSPARASVSSEAATPVVAAPPQRRPTSERVAFAVEKQTRRLRIAMIATVVVAGGVAGGVWYKSSRDAAANAHDAAERDSKIKQLVAANDSVHRELETRLQGDTALTNSLQRHNDSLTRVVRETRDAAQAAAAASELRRGHDIQRKFAETEFPAIRDENDPAVVLIVTQVGSQAFEASGFSATPSGVIVTNRHVVIDTVGQRASRIYVKFANTRTWRHARLLKLADDPNVDLALIQVDPDGSKAPTVKSISPNVDSPVGASIVTIGYPLGSDLPMEGTGSDAMAKTSLTVGTISKSVSGLLQIDAFASHGSSGSPVLDQHGHVIGVVWGGPKEAEGRIAFAVPANQIQALLSGVR